MKLSGKFMDVTLCPIVYVLVLFLFNGCKQTMAPVKKRTQHTRIDSLKWQPGSLDIHFIHTGRGNASFMVFPDGTTILFDAGDAKQRATKKYYAPFGDSLIRPGQRIADYIRAVSPKQEIDYALVSHFHNDHYGQIKKNSIKSDKGDYYLTGITEVGDIIPIKKIIDRDYPRYDFPKDLKTHLSKSDSTFLNYLKFIAYHQKESGLIGEKLEAGSTNQITLNNSPKDYPDFKVLNVKVNDQIWSNNISQVHTYDFRPPLVNVEGYYNENPLSLALKISYGDFDYYVGGDLPGVDDYPDYNIESTMANAIGEVDAMTLNHHGYKDASNLSFLTALNPQVIAHQAIHDPHFPEIVQENLLKSEADVFTMFMGKNIRERDGERINKIYKSTLGNFVIRVAPHGKTFEVLVLNPDDTVSVKEAYGPYTSRN